MEYCKSKDCTKELNVAGSTSVFLEIMTKSYIDNTRRFFKEGIAYLGGMQKDDAYLFVDNAIDQIEYIKRNFGPDDCKQHVQGGDVAMFKRDPKSMFDKQYQKLADTNSALVIKGIYDGKLGILERPKIVDTDYAVVMKSYQENGGDVDALQNIMSATFDAGEVCDAMLKFLQALRMADDKTRYALSIDTIAGYMGEE